MLPTRLASFTRSLCSQYPSQLRCDECYRIFSIFLFLLSWWFRLILYSFKLYTFHKLQQFFQSSITLCVSVFFISSQVYPGPNPLSNMIKKHKSRDQTTNKHTVNQKAKQFGDPFFTTALSCTYVKTFKPTGIQYIHNLPDINPARTISQNTYTKKI